jgi:multidrug efflux pump subunit AcrB
VRPDLLKLAASNVTLFDLLAVLRVSPSLGVNALGELPIRDYIKMHDVAIVEAGFDRESVEPAIIVHSQVGASNAEVRDRVRAAIAKLKVPIQLVEAPLPVVKKPAFVASLRGPSFDELDRIAAEMAADLKLVRDPPVATAETSVVPDRDRADTLGIPIPDIHATIRALTGAEAGMGVVDGKPVPIVLRCDGVLVDMLQHVHVRTQQGVLVPIADVVKVTAGKTRTILHHDRERAIDLSSDDPKAKQLLDQRKLPPGYRLVFLP